MLAIHIQYIIRTFIYLLLGMFFVKTNLIRKTLFLAENMTKKTIFKKALTIKHDDDINLVECFFLTTQSK